MMGTGETARWAQVLVTEPDSSASTPWTHIAEGETLLLQITFQLPHTHRARLFYHIDTNKCKNDEKSDSCFGIHYNYNNILWLYMHGVNHSGLENNWKKNLCAKYKQISPVILLRKKCGMLCTCMMCASFSLKSSTSASKYPEVCTLVLWIL